MTGLPDPKVHLSEDEAHRTFSRILDGTVPDEAIGVYLLELSDRSETAEEIAGAAKALRND